MEGKIKNTDNTYESEIYSQNNFKKEFEELLNKLNNSKIDELDNVSSIDLEFLKNDYIELYDLRKLLNEPKYHIAKFRILFLDFINLKDYFYKVLDSDELIDEEKNADKKKDKNSSIENQITNFYFSDNKAKSIEKSYKNISKQNKIQNEININYHKNSIDEGKNQQKKSRSNCNIQNSLNISDNNISKTNKSFEEIKKKAINSINSSEDSKNNEKNELNNEVKSNLINTCRVDTNNKKNESFNNSKNKPNSLDTNKAISSFIKSMNNSKISSESDLSELNQNKYEISQNENILNMTLTDIQKYIQSNKI